MNYTFFLYFSHFILFWLYFFLVKDNKPEATQILHSIWHWITLVHFRTGLWLPELNANHFSDSVPRWLLARGAVRRHASVHGCPAVAWWETFYPRPPEWTGTGSDVMTCIQMVLLLHNHMILLPHILNLFLKEIDDLPLTVDHLTVEVNHYPTQTHRQQQHSKNNEITRDLFHISTVFLREFCWSLKWFTLTGWFVCISLLSFRGETPETKLRTHRKMPAHRKRKNGFSTRYVWAETSQDSLGFTSASCCTHRFPAWNMVFRPRNGPQPSDGFILGHVTDRATTHWVTEPIERS